MRTTSVSGSLTANGTTFINDGGGTNITFTSTATLSGGTNTFNLPISVPYTLVPSLAVNTNYLNDVNINPGTLPGGTLVSLNQSAPAQPSATSFLKASPWRRGRPSTSGPMSAS